MGVVTSSRLRRKTLIDPLTERELDVLRLLAAGLKHREVADQLAVTLNTVRHHARNIYGKLGVHSRAQAVARHGIWIFCKW